MQVYGLSGVHGPQPIAAPHVGRSLPAGEASAPAPIRDELHLSPAASLVEQARSLPDIRQDRVAEVRAAIEQGNYLSEQRLGVALDRLLDEIA
jgi:hypothetical protein